MERDRTSGTAASFFHAASWVFSWRLHAGPELFDERFRRTFACFVHVWNSNCRRRLPRRLLRS